MRGKYHDRYSEAFTELEKKNAYVCESCGHTNIMHKDEAGEGKREGKGEMKEMEMHSHLPHNASLKIAHSERERVMYSDPAPFGP